MVPTKLKSGGDAPPPPVPHRSTPVLQHQLYICALWRQRVYHVNKAATTSSSVEQFIQKTHYSEDTIDEMVKVVGNHIRSKIKNSEKHCNVHVYPDGSDIVSDHNLAVLPPSLCVNIHMEPSLLRLRNLTSLVSLSIPTAFCVEDRRKPINSLT